MSSGMTVTTRTEPEIALAVAREIYFWALSGREIHYLGSPICEADLMVDGEMMLHIDPNMVDGHKHRVPSVTVTVQRRGQMTIDSVRSAVSVAVHQAIERWDYWEHGGERRARVVRALKRRPFQPRWVSAHCGCPDHATSHRN